MADLARIDARIAWAEAEEAKGKQGLWDQRSWGRSHPCGTAHCVFGQEVADDGWQPLYAWALVFHPDRPGPQRLISQVASELLDLTQEQAAAFSSASNTISRLRWLRDVFAVQQDEQPRWNGE